MEGADDSDISRKAQARNKIASKVTEGEDWEELYSNFNPAHWGVNALEYFYKLVSYTQRNPDHDTCFVRNFITGVLDIQSDNATITGTQMKKVVDQYRQQHLDPPPPKAPGKRGLEHLYGRSGAAAGSSPLRQRRRITLGDIGSHDTPGRRRSAPSSIITNAALRPMADAQQATIDKLTTVFDEGVKNQEAFVREADSALTSAREELETQEEALTEAQEALRVAQQNKSTLSQPGADALRNERALLLKRQHNLAQLEALDPAALPSGFDLAAMMNSQKDEVRKADEQVKRLEAQEARVAIVVTEEKNAKAAVTEARKKMVDAQTLVHRRERALAQAQTLLDTFRLYGRFVKAGPDVVSSSFEDQEEEGLKEGFAGEQDEVRSQIEVDDCAG